MPRACGTPGAPAEPGAHRGRASEGPSADADPAVPAQQRHQRDANREPHWAEDTMKPMIVTVAGRPRMRSSDGGRAHGDTREAEPPAQVPTWPKSDTAWKHQGGRAKGTTSTKASTASVANGDTDGRRGQRAQDYERAPDLLRGRTAVGEGWESLERAPVTTVKQPFSENRPSTVTH